ncbi:hypothetical protein KRMM14A1259_47210 [Krasilnikovia sp. MM14-A1259]
MRAYAENQVDGVSKVTLDQTPGGKYFDDKLLFEKGSPINTDQGVPGLEEDFGTLRRERERRSNRMDSRLVVGEHLENCRERTRWKTSPT